MKLQNIKIKVKTDEENQYVLKKHIELNKSILWLVILHNSNDNYNFHYYDNHAVCSVWKGFRFLVINQVGDLILFDTNKDWDKRDEPEITFEEFKEMIEPKNTLWDKLNSQKNINIPLPKFIKDKYYTMSRDSLIYEIRREHDIGMGRAEYFFKEALKEFLINLEGGSCDECRDFLETQAVQIFGKELLEEKQ